MMTRLLSLSLSALLSFQVLACSGTADEDEPMSGGNGTADATDEGGDDADESDGSAAGTGSGDDADDQDGGDGDATQPGATCQDGETTDDGCNTCTCSNGQLACTRRACLPVETCTEGDTKSADDGCNTCTCSGGAWGCTEKACESTDNACGARAGDTCSDTEYCDYQEGQSCGAADAQATCKERPFVCTAQHDPVCGCDGKTYSNSCSANGAGTGIAHSGDCK